MFEHLDSVSWKDLSDAYGAAESVPDAIRELLSEDPVTREKARRFLCRTIYHQGDIFNSTAAAVPFLVSILAADASPDRRQLASFVCEIAKSAAVTDAQITARWTKIYRTLGDLYDVPASVKISHQVHATRATRQALLREAQSLSSILLHLTPEPEETVAELAAALDNLRAVEESC